MTYVQRMAFNLFYKIKIFKKKLNREHWQHLPVNQFSSYTAFEESRASIARQNAIVFAGTGVTANNTNQSQMLDFSIAICKCHCSPVSISIVVVVLCAVGAAAIAR